MSIEPEHLHRCVVRPTLREMADVAGAPGMAAPEAEMLIMGTAAVESRLGEMLRQSVGGRPVGTALGIWQIEPETAADLLIRYLRKPRHRALREHVRETWPFLKPSRMPAIGPRAERALMADLRLGCLVARLRYWTSPDPLPAVDDVAGQALYWVEKYNRGGDGTVDRYVSAWQWHLAAWAETGGLS